MYQHGVLTIITISMVLPQVLATCDVPNCTLCNGGGNNCEACEQGFWILNKYCYKCPTNCLTCTNDSACQSCISKFWGNRCQSPCSDNCTTAGCEIQTGYCHECKSGFYGPLCQQECYLCENNQCDLRKCSTGCRDGYLQDLYGDHSYCVPCAPFCAKCNKTYFCTQCYSGSYIYQYSYDGHAISTCLNCSTQVPGCLDCKYDQNKVLCEKCDQGYVVNDSQCATTTPCLNCKNGCYSDGACVGGCKPGYTGIKCNYQCASFCSTCLQLQQDECVSCKGDFYTKKCNVQCNSNCQSGSYPRCRIDDGYCLNGCNNGFWGDQCESSCNDYCLRISTEQQPCHRNGSCMHGCKVGYMGLDCSQVSSFPTGQVTTNSTSQMSSISTSRVSSMPTDQVSSILTSQDFSISTSQVFSSTSTMPAQTDKTSRISPIVNTPKVTIADYPAGMTSKNEQVDDQIPVAAIGGGASGGAILVAVVVLVVIIFILKRRKRNAKTVDRSEAFKPACDSEHVNAESRWLNSTQPVDYIYAQVNKSKKHDINKESIGDPQTKTYSSIQIDMNDISAGEETDTEDKVKLEDLDDCEANVFVADTVAPSTDIYYNTDGLKRSRIQVSNLLNYIQGKRLPKNLTRSCNEALKPQNRAKNRYNGIYSYDATRVVLGSKEYINASHIEGYNNPRAYIASLGPTKSTMPQFAVFWEMIWQENTQKIVVLTNLMEGEKIKCDQYWPDEGSTRQYGSISVTAKAEYMYAEFAVRELHVVKARETRTVSQYHYTTWPDKTVPDTVVSLVEFRDKVEKKTTPSAGPVVVHCSAGIGRTGTYIALDSLIKEGKAENSADIFGCVNALRGQRVNMVQNAEQYEFLHHCVVYALTCQPEACDVSSLISFTTGDSMSSQFEAYTNLLPLTNKESDAIAANTRKKENRKGSDIPGDRHRVKLVETKQDYINAVFVDGYLQKDRYILAQTPMPNTVEDFISLLYQKKIGLVVSLDEEDGKDKTKGQYIAPANKVSKLGHFHVSADSCESNESFVVRTLKISKIGTSSTSDLKILHYQFQGWKCGDVVPESLQTFMSLVTAVKEHNGPEHGSVLFHCLDGGMKSGLLCAVALMLEKLTVERELSVITTICQVRGRRRNAIQNFEQFLFCYSCVQNYLETSEAKTYYNIL